MFLLIPLPLFMMMKYLLKEEGSTPFGIVYTSHLHDPLHREALHFFDDGFAPIMRYRHDAIWIYRSIEEGGPIGARTHSAVADWNGARPAGQSIDSVDRWWRLDWISQRDCVVLQEKARALAAAAAAAALINGGRCNFILDRTQLSLGRPKIRRTKTHTQNRVPSSW